LRLHTHDTSKFKHASMGSLPIGHPAVGSFIVNGFLSNLLDISNGFIETGINESGSVDTDSLTPNLTVYFFNPKGHNCLLKLFTCAIFTRFPPAPSSLSSQERMYSPHRFQLHNHMIIIDFFLSIGRLKAIQFKGFTILPKS